MITLLRVPADLDRAEIDIEGDAYRHLFRARRVAAGERVRLADGAGRARWGEVTAVGRSAATVRVGGEAPANVPAVRVQLLVAVPKKERAVWLVEKATELGVAAVRLLETARTPREFGEGTLRRLERVAAAALEQSHGSRLPELSGTHPWGEVPALLVAAGEGTARWVLDTEGAEAAGRDLAPGPAGSAALLVGPEGGWTGDERADLAGWGCRAVSLGPTALRVETAALAAAALVLSLPLDLRRPARGASIDG